MPYWMHEGWPPIKGEEIGEDARRSRDIRERQQAAKTVLDMRLCLCDNAARRERQNSFRAAWNCPPLPRFDVPTLAEFQGMAEEQRARLFQK